MDIPFFEVSFGIDFKASRVHFAGTAWWKPLYFTCICRVWSKMLRFFLNMYSVLGVLQTWQHGTHHVKSIKSTLMPGL